MALRDLDDQRAVISAIQECDRLGRDAFLQKYGFHEATRFMVEHDGREYDSKAIAGVAHGYQHPNLGPLAAADFSGGTPVTVKLQAMGFSIRDLGGPPPSDRVFGDVGVPLGTVFPTRRELSASGVHRPTQAGISGSEADGADSIVVSGGYEDDEDTGTVIIYTGHGGNDPATKKQIADQEFHRGNRALARSCDEGLPVRVVRGSGGDPQHSPRTGFRYDGLFSVDSYWVESGRSGFRVWRYRLVQVPDPLGWDNEGTAGAPARTQVTVQRIVRNTAVATWVKREHDHACQVCGLRIETPAGPYAEGAHIRPLGRPHNGPDSADNILCLCPNHHVMFDTGAISINSELQVCEGASGPTTRPLRLARRHALDLRNLAYHRTHVAADET